MAMLAEYHSLPDDSGLSLPLVTQFTICEASLFSVGQDFLNIEDKFKSLQTILECIEKVILIEEQKGLLNDMKTEFEHIILSADIHVLQEYLNSVIENKFMSGLKHFSPICLFYLIAYHVLVASEKENSTQILNVITDSQEVKKFNLHSALECIYPLYLDIYYKDNANEVFTNIHTFWKFDPLIELELKLVYCKTLMKAKDYKTVKQLIHQHADKFIESFEVMHKFIVFNNKTTSTIVLLHILHYQVSTNKMEKVKTIETLLSLIIDYRVNNTHNYWLRDQHYLFKAFYEFIIALDNQQIQCTPHVFKLLQPESKCCQLDCLKIILLCSNELRQAKQYTECIKFIKYNFQFVSSFPTCLLTIKGECYYRQQYCITLLLLLDEYVSLNDTHNMKLVVTKLLDFRISFLSNIPSNSCYCFMANQECSTKREKNLADSPPLPSRSRRYATEFKTELLYCYKRKLNRTKLNMYSPLSLPSSRYAYEFHNFDSMINKVIQGEFKLAPYLECMIELMSIKMYKDDVPIVFMEFIKRSADYNTAILYDIINFFCAYFAFKPVQDVVIQGLIAYLIISCNGKCGMLSKFILNINMKCPKGQFLQIMTKEIAKLLLKLEEDTVNDFKKMIYQCYCTVRHDSKSKKDANIIRYKEHYTFIASIEAEEEMQKLSDLTNFLPMLTLLLIAAGGHHKSAELKKYLSLKYEYENSILYLLWCSGDVEINPGPTLKILRKVENSVKERDWLNEMCSILGRIIKYKSIDLKNDDLWKEKPLHWTPGWPFYDPRNKPEDRGYNTDTDKKLLTHLVEYCYEKGVFQDTKQVDANPKISLLTQYRKEITAWQNDQTELFALYIFRKIQDTLKAARGSLHKYRDDPELQQCLKYLDLDLIFDSGEICNARNGGFTDIIRDIAITLCRIAKELNPLEKSDRLWKTKPIGWNPDHPYYSPCNAGKGKEKNKDRTLVNNLLTYCELEGKTIPTEIQRLIKAWKQGKTSEITKYYTIWSKTAIINHSLKYLELENMLGQIHILKSLRQIGILLDTQQWRCPSVITSCARENDDKRQDSRSSPSSDIETNSTAKVENIQINSDNQNTQLPDSTQTKSKPTPASPHSIVNHTDSHLCNISFDQQSQLNLSFKHTCVNSFKDRCPILSSKAQPEAVDYHQPIPSVISINSSNWNEKLIPSTVNIYDAKSKQEKNNKILKTTKKRKHQSTDENYTEPKKLHVFDKGKSSQIPSSSTDQCQGEPINDQTPITVLDDILDLQDESNLNKNSSSFNIPPFITLSMRISHGDTTHAFQQENPIETIVEYLKK